MTDHTEIKRWPSGAACDGVVLFDPTEDEDWTETMPITSGCIVEYIEPKCAYGCGLPLRRLGDPVRQTTKTFGVLYFCCVAHQHYWLDAHPGEWCLTDHTAGPIKEARERGLLPEAVEVWFGWFHGHSPYPQSPWGEPGPTDKAITALAARLLELDDENKRLDSWDGHMRWLDKWYPPATFDGSSGDPGPTIIKLTRELAAEKARADEAVERAEKAEAMLREHWRRSHDFNCAGKSIWGQTCADWLADLARRTQSHA
jgi:hypothetical protein